MLKSEVASGPTYHIRVFRTGRCRIIGKYAYHDYAVERDHPFTLYVSVIQGNGLTALVDVGMKSVAAMNRDAGFLMTALIAQEPGEDVPGILTKAKIDAADVDYIFLTHAHYDHCSNLALFPNATVVIPAYAWRLWHEEPERAIYLHAGFLSELEALQSQERLLLLDEGVVAPGLGVRWVGGHSICSQFIYVNTARGVAVFTGDTVQMYANIAHNAIIGIYDDAAQCQRAIETARAGDETGRSAMAHMVHLSELAFYPDPEAALTAVLQIQGDGPGTWTIVESTANGAGNFFHQLWLDAEEGRNDFIPLFFPWFEDPEYRMEIPDGSRSEFEKSLNDEEKELLNRFDLDLEQLFWRRWAIRNKCRNSIEVFHQEYPSTAEEAFLHSGAPVFDIKRIMELEKRAVPPERFVLGLRQEE